jgi:hypothetical protein
MLERTPTSRRCRFSQACAAARPKPPQLLQEVPPGVELALGRQLREFLLVGDHGQGAGPL